MPRRTFVAIVFASSLLAGCDMLGGALGIESPEKVAAVREADGRAIGGACRHAGRAIEDCYALNRKADKASMFAGWRDMNDYMRENKIEAVAPQLAVSPPAPPATQVAGAKAEAAESDSSAKPVSDKPTKPDVAKRGKAHDS